MDLGAGSFSVSEFGKFGIFVGVVVEAKREKERESEREKGRRKRRKRIGLREKKCEKGLEEVL